MGVGSDRVNDQQETCLSIVAVDQDGVRPQVPVDPAFLVHAGHCARQRDEGHEKAKVTGSELVLVTLVVWVPEQTPQGSLFQTDTPRAVFPFLEEGRKQRENVI